MKKRGMSGIIITIIMIALALVLIGVVWAVISNIVSKSSENTESTASQLLSTAAELGLVKMEKGQSCYGTEVVCKDGLACDGIVPDQIPGIVGYWDFDGDVKDSSGEGNHGEIVGNPEFVDGVAGDALEFDGVNDYVNCGADESLSFGKDTFDSPFTFAWWVKLTENDGSRYFGKEGEFSIRSSNNLRTQLTDTSAGGHLQKSFGSLATYEGEWVFVIITYDGSGVSTGIKAYVNNVERSGTNEDSGTYVAMEDSSGDFYLGRDSTGFCLNGALDEARVYNRVLNSTEITALYEAP